MRQRVFLVRNATAPIREIEAEIVTGKKMTWAELANGRRHLLGATAFFTLPSAYVRKLGLLRKLAEGPRIPLLYYRIDDAIVQLKQYKQTGKLPERRIAA